jgi:plasmid rolling circle replication initiator protein Rep
METEKVRTHGVVSRTTSQNPKMCCIFATFSYNPHFSGLFSCNPSGFLIGLVYKMRKTHKNNNSINCDTLYTIQTSKTMIVYTDNMKNNNKDNTLCQK